MIDLHTHTTASDGTDAPLDLVRRARELGLSALAISDHDTLAGVDEVLESGAAGSLDVVRGIELSTRVEGEGDRRRRNAHLLGYFFDEPGAGFRAWLKELRRNRRERNGAIAERLQALGLDVHLEEAEALGRNITARPHFAAVMIRKGYVSNLREAFDRYLSETGAAYVEREDPPLETAVARVHAAGGVASLAHAVRLNQSDRARERELIARWAAAGLDAIEVWHPDHDDSAVARYSEIAARGGLARTGGSDFHGDHTPGILPGIGDGRLNVGARALDELRQIARARAQLLSLPRIEPHVAERANRTFGR
jgi:predicted metal-dependent phosphoesterase TrpH